MHSTTMLNVPRRRPCWWRLAAVAIFALCAPLAWCGTPGGADASFQVSYPAARGMLRPDGSCVVAGAGVVTVVNHDGTVRHGPFLTGLASRCLTDELALLQDGSVVGAFYDNLIDTAKNRSLVFKVSPSGEFSIVPIQGGDYEIFIHAFADLGRERWAVSGTFPVWRPAAHAGSVLAILSPERNLEPDSGHECWGGGWGRAGSVQGLIPAGEGGFLAFGYFTMVDESPRNGIVRMLNDGQIDDSFRPELGLNSSIWGAAVLSDGKIVVGGWLSLPHLGLVTVARLMPDGSLDRTFRPPAGTPLDRSFVLVRSLAVDPWQRIIIFGLFDSINGVPRPGLARLNADGTLDASFQPQQPFPSTAGGGTYPEFQVDVHGDVYGFGVGFATGAFVNYQTIRVLGNGPEAAPPSLPVNTVLSSLASGGEITLSAPVSGDPAPMIRWTRNGATLPGATNSTLHLNAVGLPDIGAYRVAASNAFGTVERQVVVIGITNVVIPSPGALDLGFRGPTNNTTSIAMLALPDRSTLVAFSEQIGFSQTDTVGELVHGVRRLRADGSVDPGFWTRLTLKESITQLSCSLAILPDGKFVIGGNFEKVNGVSRRSVARLMPDGSTDPSFDASSGAAGEVTSVLFTPELGVVVGGQFSRFQDQATGPLLVLQDDGQRSPGWPKAAFSPREGVLRVWNLPDGNLGVWTTGPQDASGKGAQCSRIARSGETIDAMLTVPREANLLAADTTPDGRLVVATSARTNQPHTVLSSLSWAGETNQSSGPSAIVFGRVSALAVDRSAGVVLAGVAPLNWPSGSPSPVLRLDPSWKPDQTFSYNSGIGVLGNVRSPLLSLSTGRVLLPTTNGIRGFYADAEVTTVPRLIGELGDQVFEMPTPGLSDSGSVLLTAPIIGKNLSYSWWFNGTPLAGASRSTLVLSNLSMGMLGGYRVIASNSFGSVTSQMARVRGVARAPSSKPIAGPINPNWGSSLSVPASVAGSWPLKMQWYRDGKPVIGQTGSTLKLDVVSPEDRGLYQIAVSNAVGTHWGAPIRVGLLPSPLPIAEVLDTPGATWTGSRSWLPEVSKSTDGLGAVCAFSDVDGGSATIQLRLIGPGFLYFYWKLDRVSIAPLFYDFLIDGKKPVPVPGRDSLNAPYSSWAEQQIYIPADSHTAGWKFNWFSSASGDVAYLDRVRFIPDSPQPPRIEQQPSPAATMEGEQIQFGVVAYSFLPTAYQWRKDGKEIPGATGQVFRLAGASLADEGNYDVVVSNASGSVTSVAVRATVLPSTANTRLPLPSLDADGIPSFVVPQQAAMGLDLQRSENLIDWVSVPSWVVASGDGTVRLIDPMVERAPQKFYRFVPLR